MSAHAFAYLSRIMDARNDAATIMTMCDDDDNDNGQLVHAREQPQQTVACLLRLLPAACPYLRNSRTAIVRARSRLFEYGTRNGRSVYFSNSKYIIYKTCDDGARGVLAICKYINRSIYGCCAELQMLLHVPYRSADAAIQQVSSVLYYYDAVRSQQTHTHTHYWFDGCVCWLAVLDDSAHKSSLCVTFCIQSRECAEKMDRSIFRWGRKHHVRSVNKPPPATLSWPPSPSSSPSLFESRKRELAFVLVHFQQLPRVDAVTFDFGHFTKAPAKSSCRQH